MEKIFVHVALKASFTEALQTKYSNSIVFIKDSGEIYTHGKFYGLSTDWQNRIVSAESDIDALLTAILALLSINAFTTISDGTNSASATSIAKTIKFNASGKASVSVGADGVTIGASGTALSEGSSNGQTSVDGVSKSIVKGLNTAAYHPEDYFCTAEEGRLLTDAIEEAKQVANSKVSSVVAADNSGIIITGTNTAPVVELKLDTTTPGNVNLVLGANGLKASVTIPSATVTGVASGDKVLSLTGTSLSATLGLNYDSASKNIQLLGIGDEVIATISASEFIKDGMVSSVSFNPSTKNLTVSFNTDSGKEDIVVDMTSLVDTYTSGNGVSIQNNVVSVKVDNTSESFLAVGSGGLKVSGIQSAINSAKDLLIGEDGDEASAVTIYGAKAYADSLSNNYATASLGSKADSALQSIVKGTDGSYVTTTVGAKSGLSLTISTSVKVQAIASASSSSKGLAESSDVKTYVDNLLVWEEL